MNVYGKKALFLYGLPAQKDGPLASSVIQGLVDIADEYDLNSERLTEAGALVLTMHNDQRWLHKNGEAITSFVESGGTLVIQGQIALPWTGFLQPYLPIIRPRMDQLVVQAACDHPVFNGLDRSVLNIRKGVRGFYARGHNPPPSGARVLQTVADDVPVDWEWRCGSGRVLMHSGNDLWTTQETPDANIEFAKRLLSWAIADGGPA